MGNTANTLIVYYSWSGTTESAAKQIANMTGGHLVKLEPEKSYPKSYGMTAQFSLVEQLRHAWPKIKTAIPNFEQYDRVLIGFLIWWYSCPMLICSFLEQYDFSGKQVYGFCTHGGSGPSKSFSTMRKACKTADVQNCLDANTITDRGIADWLGGEQK